MFGCLKNKFAVLKGMRVNMKTSMDVIAACVVLWNYLLDEGERLLPEEQGQENEDTEEILTIACDSANQSETRKGEAIRQNIVHSLSHDAAHVDLDV